jgi:hypothetical protein
MSRHFDVLGTRQVSIDPGELSAVLSGLRHRTLLLVDHDGHVVGATAAGTQSWPWALDKKAPCAQLKDSGGNAFVILSHGQVENDGSVYHLVEVASETEDANTAKVTSPPMVPTQVEPVAASTAASAAGSAAASTLHTRFTPSVDAPMFAADLSAAPAQGRPSSRRRRRRTSNMGGAGGGAGSGSDNGNVRRVSPRSRELSDAIHRDRAPACLPAVSAPPRPLFPPSFVTSAASSVPPLAGCAPLHVVPPTAAAAPPTLAQPTHSDIWSDLVVDAPIGNGDLGLAPPHGSSVHVAEPYGPPHHQLSHLPGAPVAVAQPPLPTLPPFTPGADLPLLPFSEVTALPVQPGPPDAVPFTACNTYNPVLPPLAATPTLPPRAACEHTAGEQSIGAPTQMQAGGLLPSAFPCLLGTPPSITNATAIATVDFVASAALAAVASADATDTATVLTAVASTAAKTSSSNVASGVQSAIGVTNAAGRSIEAHGSGLAPSVVWDAFKTSSTSYYMEAGDPNPVLIVPAPDQPTLPAPVPPLGVHVTLGVVCMTKQPVDLLTWLQYHHSQLGAVRFFLRIEDTPELASLLATPPYDHLVVATFDDHTQRDYFGQMDRQSAHIAAATSAARAAGLTHLLHIDDDELLYCAQGAARLHIELAAAPADRPDCHLSNVEALFPSSSCTSPFREVTCFRHLPTRYVSYTNGKSIARLDSPTIRAHGPHHFRTDTAAGGKGSVITHMIAPDVGVILQYESPTYAKWQSKYLDLAVRHGSDADVFSRVPFAFYRHSITAAYAILVARRSGDFAAEAEAVAAAHALWCEHKLAPPHLPPPTARPMRVPDGLTLLWPVEE